MVRQIISKFFASLRQLGHWVIPYSRWGDRLISLWQFVSAHKRLPNSSNGFNDVLYRIKTSDEITDPLRVFVTDKELAKLFIAATIGPDYPVPTLAVLRSPEDVDTFDFPDTCCIKPTHSSAMIILRKDGEEIDRERIKSWFTHNYYFRFREANYRYLQPKIIVEPLLFNSKSVIDYKCFCYNGEPRAIQVDIDRRGDWKAGMFHTDWTEHQVTVDAELGHPAMQKPANLDQMLAAAKKLCQHFPTIRVDMYSNGEDFYIGELTNCAGGAIQPMPPGAREDELSELIYGADWRHPANQAGG